MYQFQNLKDTIAAISTATGVGGIGIVRLSGDAALEIADKVFIAKNPGAGKPSEFKTYTIHYGHVVVHQNEDEAPEIIDEVLLSVMRGPKSYTCEHVVEISCHGGIVPLRVILDLVVASGARLAEPGEFTKRAFLNGRIDLTQAEAVLDIIQSRTDAFLKVSSHQLKGDLRLALENIREALMQTYTAVEVVVNFPEDDVDDKGTDDILHATQNAWKQVEALLASSQQGRILREGIKVVICGKPNVGKSSLLNILLRQPRAIVTHVEGTTRDTIEESAEIQGVPLELVDTAGILEPRDLVEAEAIKRSHLHIQGADLVLFVVDASREFSEEDAKVSGKIKEQNVIVVVNKNDLEKAIDENKIVQCCPEKKIVSVSAERKEGIDQLEEAIIENVLSGTAVNPHSLLVSNMRHISSLRACVSGLEKAERLLRQKISLEFVSEEIKQCINELDSITGRNIDSDLLDKIFAEFCIGK